MKAVYYTVYDDILEIRRQAMLANRRIKFIALSPEEMYELQCCMNLNINYPTVPNSLFGIPVKVVSK